MASVNIMQRIADLACPVNTAERLKYESIVNVHNCDFYVFGIVGGYFNAKSVNGFAYVCGISSICLLNAGKKYEQGIM